MKHIWMILMGAVLVAAVTACDPQEPEPDNGPVPEGEGVEQGEPVPPQVDGDSGSSQPSGNEINAQGADDDPMGDGDAEYTEGDDN